MHTRRVCANQRETVMSGEKETGTAEPALKVGGLYKVTNPTSEHFGKVGALRSVVSYAEGLDIPTPKRPLWIEFIVWSGLHHCHTQCDFARDEVGPYEIEDADLQALVSTAETMHDDGQIEQLRTALNELQTNQAEHATHLDLLQQNADSQRTKWAADRMRLNALAQDIATANKARDQLAQSSKDLWRKVGKIEEAIDAMKYRRMVGNLFRRVADAVDGG